MNSPEPIARFQVGDRVRVTAKGYDGVTTLLPCVILQPSFRDQVGTWWTLVISIVDRDADVDYANDPDCIDDLDRNAVTKSAYVRVDDLKLVARYVAVTPTRVKALNFVLRATFHPESEHFMHGDVEREIIAMMAEARGEVRA